MVRNVDNDESSLSIGRVKGDTRVHVNGLRLESGNTRPCANVYCNMSDRSAVGVTPLCDRVIRRISMKYDDLSRSLA